MPLHQEAGHSGDGVCVCNLCCLCETSMMHTALGAAAGQERVALGRGKLHSSG